MILVSCQTWLRSLFPSRWGSLPSGVLHRELHVSPQQSSVRGTRSPRVAGLPKTEEVLSSCLLEKAGLGDVSVPKTPNPSRCLLSLPSHSSPEGNWLEGKQIEAGGGGPVSRPLSWKI